jgi:hypothetical protein
MYDWFEQMLTEVRTPRFFAVDGPAQADLRAAIASDELGLPDSYKQFVLQFGGAKLFHRGNGYLIEVFGGPRRIRVEGIGNLIQFGRTDLAPSYFVEDELSEGKECPVYEFDKEQGLHQVAEGFGSWLRETCRSARSLYDAKSWAQVRLGAAPFTAEELAIVEARKRFLWRVIGINPENEVLFEVTNNSSRTLPYLSIGIRRRGEFLADGPLLGIVWIPTRASR